MATENEITTALGLADSFYIELIESFYAQDISCGNPDGSQMLNIAMLSTQLREQVSQGLIDDTITTALYGQLLIAIEDYSGSSLPINPNAQIPGTTIIVTQSDLIYTTAVVTPGDVAYYDFPETIGTTPLVAYRGTGTTLQPWVSAADNEHIQFDSTTGRFTPSYAFGAGETFWVQYSITS